MVSPDASRVPSAWSLRTIVQPLRPGPGSTTGTWERLSNVKPTPSLASRPATTCSACSQNSSRSPRDSSISNSHTSVAPSAPGPQLECSILTITAYRPSHSPGTSPCPPCPKPSHPSRPSAAKDAAANEQRLGEDGMRASLPATSPGALGASSGVVRPRPADPPMSPFDRSLALRVVGVVFVTAALAAVVIVATDESGSTAPMRVARLCALQPALAALGCWAVQAQAEARGELRALLGLGASPWRLCRGPCVAAWGLGALALVTLASPWADPSSLFPVVAPAAWERVGGQLVDPVHGVSVDARGALRFLGQSARRVAQGPGAAAACWALA